MQKHIMCDSEWGNGLDVCTICHKKSKQEKDFTDHRCIIDSYAYQGIVFGKCSFCKSNPFFHIMVVAALTTQLTSADISTLPVAGPSGHRMWEMQP